MKYRPTYTQFAFRRSWLTALLVGANLVAATAQAQNAASAPAAQAPTASSTAMPAAPAPAPVAATPPTAEQLAAAETAISAGKEAYKSGDYMTAETQFRAALAAADSAAAQYWLAMALDLQTKTTDAVDAFELALANPAAVAQLSAEELEVANKRLQVLRAIPATLRLSLTPADAKLSLDGKPLEGANPYTLQLVAGKHVLEATAEGFQPLRSELELKPAQQLEQALTLAAVPAPPTPPAPPEAAEPEPAAPPPPAEMSKTPAYVTLGVAGASAIVGAIFGIQALGAKDDFNADPTAANADEVERNALIADMAFGVAVTLGITGAVLIWGDEPAATGSASARTKTAKNDLLVAPFVSPTSAGAAARWSF